MNFQRKIVALGMGSDRRKALSRLRKKLEELMTTLLKRRSMNRKAKRR